MQFNKRQIALVAVLTVVVGILLWIAIYAFMDLTESSVFGRSYEPGRSLEQRSSVQTRAKNTPDVSNRYSDSNNARAGNNNAGAIDWRSAAPANLASEAGQNLSLQDEPEQATTHTMIRAVKATLVVQASKKCRENYVAFVEFRQDSKALLGGSRQSLNKLIEQYKKCNNSEILITTTYSNESSVMLDQRRQDEVKYYFLENGVSKSAIKKIDE